MLNAADAAIKGGAAPPPSPVPVKVKTEAQRLPEPVRSMMDTLGDSSARISQMMVRQNLSGEVRSQVGEFCQQADRRPLSDRPQRPARRDAGRLRAAVRPRRQDRPAVPAAARRLRRHDDAAVAVQAGRRRAARHRHRQPAASSSAPRRSARPSSPAGNAPTLKLQIKPVEMDALDQATHPRHRRPDRPLRPRPADPDAGRHGPGRAAAGQVRVQRQPARLGNDLRHGLRRAVGAACACSTASTSSRSRIRR